MRGLLTLALDTAFSPRALLWAPVVPAGALALFVLTWGDGTGAAAWPAWSFYEQVRFVEAGVLLWAVPWMARRALPAQTSAEMVRLSALTGAAPSRLLLGRAVAAVVAAALTVLFATPLAILAQRMSGGSLARMALDEAAFVGLAAVAAITALWIDRWIAAPALAWVLGVVVVAVVAGLLRGVLDAPAELALAAVALAAVALFALMHVADGAVLPDREETT